MYANVLSAQVLWIPWREQWLSTSDDGEFRLWSTAGALMFRFSYNGGSVLSALADCEHELVLVAMADNRIRIFDVADPIPKGRCASPPRTVFSVLASPFRCPQEAQHEIALPASLE